MPLSIFLIRMNYQKYKSLFNLTLSSYTQYLSILLCFLFLHLIVALEISSEINKKKETKQKGKTKWQYNTKD